MSSVIPGAGMRGTRGNLVPVAAPARIFATRKQNRSVEKLKNIAAADRFAQKEGIA